MLFAALSANANADSDPVKTGVAIQSAEGVTDATWTTELLKFQTKQMSELSTKVGKQTFIDHGRSPASWKPMTSYESSFYIVGGKKYGIIKAHVRLASPTTNFTISTNAIRIMAIQGNDLVSVSCWRMSDRPISVTDSPCKDAIMENLGVSLAM